MLETLGGNNVATFHNFDAAGVVIGKKAEGIVSLGVDLDLVKKLRIPLADVEEEYDSNKGGHWKWLRDNYPKYEQIDYLKHKRVEIDSINAIIGAQKLWNAVLDRLEKAFPNRNYNRALNIYDYTTPVWYDDFAAMAVNLFRRATAAYNEQLEEEYTNYEDFIKDVYREENKIALNQIEECEKDDTVYELRKRLEGITHWLQTKKEGRRGVY